MIVWLGPTVPVCGEGGQAGLGSEQGLACLLWRTESPGWRLRVGWGEGGIGQGKEDLTGWASDKITYNVKVTKFRLRRAILYRAHIVCQVLC